MYRTEAYYNPATNELCDIPPMLNQRESSTTTGFTSCGGVNLDDDIMYDCETFDPSTGNWEVTAYLEDIWVNHVAWQSPDGICLMSGLYTPMNSTCFDNELMFPATL